MSNSTHVTKRAPSQLFSACLPLSGLIALCIALPAALLFPTYFVENRGNLAPIVLFGIAHAVLVGFLINLNFNQRFRNIAYLNLIVLIVFMIGATMLFDSAVAELVVIAQRVARAPIGVIGNSLNEVVRASIPKRNGIYKTFKTIFYSCLTVAELMIAFVMLVPESLYGWFSVLSGLE